MRIILLLLFVTISKGFASPTIYGPTGLIEMPTAESIAYKQVNLAVDYSLTNSDPNNDLNSTDPENHFFYKFNFNNCFGTFKTVLPWNKYSKWCSILIWAFFTI